MGVVAAKNQILRISDPKMVGGQIFAGYPNTRPDVAAAWSNVWEALVLDLIQPPLTTPPAASKAAWAAGMSPLISSTTGIAALSGAAQLAFPALAPSIAPMLLASPPPVPLATLLRAALAPFAAGTDDPIAPAQAVAGAFGAWLMSAMWTPPVPPSPHPFVVAP